MSSMQKNSNKVIRQTDRFIYLTKNLACKIVQFWKLFWHKIMIGYIINCNYTYCISYLNYCYYTYLSKTEKNILIYYFKYRCGDIWLDEFQQVNWFCSISLIFYDLENEVNFIILCPWQYIRCTRKVLFCLLSILYACFLVRQVKILLSCPFITVGNLFLMDAAKILSSTITVSCNN